MEVLALLAFFGPFYFCYVKFYRAWISADPDITPFRRWVRASLLSYVWLVGVFAVEVSNVLCFCIGLVLGIAAMLMFFSDLQTWWRFRMERWRYRQINPEPKYQIWMQDLLALVFSVGFAMLVWRQVMEAYTADFPLIVAALINLLVAQLVTFLGTLDALRLSPPHTPKQRLRNVVLMLLLTASVPIVPCTFVAWLAWRRAIWIERLGAPQVTFSFH